MKLRISIGLMAGLIAVHFQMSPVLAQDGGFYGAYKSLKTTEDCMNLKGDAGKWCIIFQAYYNSKHFDKEVGFTHEELEQRREGLLRSLSEGSVSSSPARRELKQAKNRKAVEIKATQICEPHFMSGTLFPSCVGAWVALFNQNCADLWGGQKFKTKNKKGEQIQVEHKNALTNISPAGRGIAYHACRAVELGREKSDCKAAPAKISKELAEFWGKLDYDHWYKLSDEQVEKSSVEICEGMSQMRLEANHNKGAAKEPHKHSHRQIKHLPEVSPGTKHKGISDPDRNAVKSD